MIGCAIVKVAAYKGRLSTAARKASVAIVLRVTGLPTTKARYTIDELVEAESGDVEVLYIRRAFNPKDPWSGNVAFPGGRQEKGETDKETAIRETMEEIGLDLKSDDFYCLGRLDDRDIFARGRRVGGFAMCPFLFVQLVVVTPPMTLNKDEVGAVRWAPLKHLARENIDPAGIERPLTMVPGTRALPEKARVALGVDKVNFPSVRLPVTKGPHDDGGEFNLWGLSLQATSDLLMVLGDRPRLSWPPIRFQSRVLRAVTYTYCGLKEWMQMGRYGFMWKHQLMAASAVTASSMVIGLTLRAML